MLNAKENWKEIQKQITNPKKQTCPLWNCGKTNDIGNDLC